MENKNTNILGVNVQSAKQFWDAILSQRVYLKCLVLTLNYTYFTSYMNKLFIISFSFTFLNPFDIYIIFHLTVALINIKSIKRSACLWQFNSFKVI